MNDSQFCYIAFITQTFTTTNAREYKYFQLYGFLWTTYHYNNFLRYGTNIYNNTVYQLTQLEYFKTSHYQIPRKHIIHPKNFKFLVQISYFSIFSLALLVDRSNMSFEIASRQPYSLPFTIPRINEICKMTIFWHRMTEYISRMVASRS